MKEQISILILEDNPYDQDLLLRELRKTGMPFTYRLTQNRSSFQDALNDCIPDIVLADYSLPSFDGYSAYRMLRSQDADIPFIIVSGSVGEESAVELIKSGVTDYVLKERLFTLHSKMQRALHDYHRGQAEKIADERIRMQNKKLAEIAHFQSHIVRTPICQMQGLFNLIDFENFSNPDNEELISCLKVVAENIDEIIHKIVRMTNEVERMSSELI